MQTSANVSHPPLDAARTCKYQPGENNQSASTVSQRCTDRFVRLDSDCGCHRLRLNRYLADLADEFDGHSVRSGHGVTFAYTDTRPSSAEKDIGRCPVTYRCGLLRCDEFHRQPSNSYLEERVREFLNLASLFVHVNRHNHPRSTHSTRYFSWIRPRL